MSPSLRTSVAGQGQILVAALGLLIAGMTAQPAAAQEDSVDSAASALQQVLLTLQQSVKKLSVDNNELSARNQSYQQQVLQLKTRLSDLQSQADTLNRKALRLRESNPQRQQEILRLQEEDRQLDARLGQTEKGITSVQKALGSQDAGPLTQAPSGEIQSQTEKLHLMKMIYDSQQRQEELQDSILKLRKDGLSPLASAQGRADTLKAEIKGLQDEILKSQARTAPSAGAPSGDEAQLARLELDLKSLRENYGQLKDLMGQINKRGGVVPLTPQEHADQLKLQASLDDLDRQGKGLRVQLDELRTQMVDMDKRKSRLDEMLRQLPSAL